MMIEIDRSGVKYNRKNRSVIWNLPIEQFKELVRNSESIGQILKYFDLQNKGRNNETIKRRCIKENVDITHLKFGKNSNKGRKFIVKKIPLSDILIENSSYNRFNLKKRLVEENVLEYKCRDCGNTGIWNGKIISLQLEHINGVLTDNRIENICFLCPNCHSQTATFAGKNRNK